VKPSPLKQVDNEEGEEEEEEEEDEGEGEEGDDDDEEMIEGDEGDDQEEEMDAGETSMFSEGNGSPSNKRARYEESAAELTGLSKHERRREVNRLAAQRSRQKKSERLKEIASRAHSVKEMGEKLVAQRDELLEEVKHLEGLVASHSKLTCHNQRGLPAPFPVTMSLLSSSYDPDSPTVNGSSFPSAPIVAPTPSSSGHDIFTPSALPFPSPSIFSATYLNSPTPIGSPQARGADASSQRKTRSRS